MHWRNWEKRNDQEHQEKESFSSSWILEWFFCLLFEKMPSSLHVLLVMLFIYVRKRSSSRWQMFFKTGVLKNFAMFTRKHLCWSLFLKKLQDWRPTFSLKKICKILQDFEYCKIFKNSFFIEHLFIILLRNFMWW